MDRRLAAILVADVVGFSRLMEADEAGTIAALRQRRAAVLDPVVKEHRGRIVKVMGDGVLVEFASAVNAVAAAVDLQKRMAQANAGVADERHIVLRIGINLGDVVGAGSDIYGEGVNIAARLESLAEPGGICVSAKVRDEVVGKTAAAFEDMGEQALKNIAAPVRVWRLASGDGSAAVPRPLASPPKRDTSKPSVAVLPFDNMSGDADQEYFSDGITEDIITALSRFRSLFVIARNSSFAFRGQKLTMPEIAKRLGVDYVLEGSVRRAANRVRITAQLIEAASGNHVWSERYDRSLEDIFAVQEEVATIVSSTLVGNLNLDLAMRAKLKPPNSVAAYDCTILGFQYHQKFTHEDNQRARELLLRAIEIDPSYAEAHAYLALVDIADWSQNLTATSLRSATASAIKSVNSDSSNARCHTILGFCLLFSGDFGRSEFHHERSIALNENDADVAVHMGLFCSYMRRSADSRRWFDRALKLNPISPDWYTSFIGYAAYMDKGYVDAERCLTLETNWIWELMYLAASLGQLGRKAEARSALDACARLKPDIPVIKFALAEPYKNPADTEHLIEGLRKAGLDC